MNSIDYKDCNLLEKKAYRCVDFETYMEKQGGLNTFEKNILQELTLLEKHLQHSGFHSRASNL